MAIVDRPAELSEQVLESVETAQRATIDAMREFVEAVDSTQAHGDDNSRRQELIDSALEMVGRLVHAQHDFLRNVVDGAGKALDQRAPVHPQGVFEEGDCARIRLASYFA